MKVNTDSWHYRLYRFYCFRCIDYVPYDWKAPNLCTYVQRIVGAVAMTLFLIAILGGVLACAVWSFVTKPLASLALTALILGIIGAVYGFDRFRYWMRDRQSAPTERPPGIFLAYLRAKKRRVCPLIEFVEPK